MEDKDATEEEDDDNLVEEENIDAEEVERVIAKLEKEEAEECKKQYETAKVPRDGEVLCIKKPQETTHLLQGRQDGDVHKSKLSVHNCLTGLVTSLCGPSWAEWISY